MTAGAIDVHAHMIDCEFLRTLSRQKNRIQTVGEEEGGFRTRSGPMHPGTYLLEKRLAHLAKFNFDLQLVAPPPQMQSRPDWAPDAVESRLLNSSTSRLVKASGGKLVGLVVPPWGEPGVLVAETEYWLAQPEFRGVAMPTSCAGRPLDQCNLDPLYALLAKRQIPIFMHPVTAKSIPALEDWTLNTAVGWPCETAIAISRLIFSGVFERFDLRLVLAHGGGILPIIAGRLDLAWSAPQYENNDQCRKNIVHAPTTYLKRLIFDSLVSSPLALRFLIAFAGVDHVVFGSDCPYEIGDAEGEVSLSALDALPDLERSAIRHKTMEGLLRL